MLDPFSRGAILALTGLCVFGAIALAPIPARSFGQQSESHGLPFAGIRAGASAGIIIPIRRDPFAEPAAGGALAATPDVAPARSFGEPGGALPSNLASDSIPGLPGGPSDEPGGPSDPKGSSTPAAATRVTAIVTGAHPYAMIESDGINEIKGLGDRVGGIAIVAIDIDGVRLQNGTRLGVDPGPRP